MPRGAPPGGAGAPRAQGNQYMTRPAAWTTVAIPKELYDEIRSHFVPKRAKSVQAYVAFWARAGSLIDRALEQNPKDGSASERVLRALRSLEEKP